MLGKTVDDQYPSSAVAGKVLKGSGALTVGSNNEKSSRILGSRHPPPARVSVRQYSTACGCVSPRTVGIASHSRPVTLSSTVPLARNVYEAGFGNSGRLAGLGIRNPSCLVGSTMAVPVHMSS